MKKIVQFTSSIDEGVELLIVAEGESVEDFVDAVNAGTAKIVFDDCSDFRKEKTVLDLFKHSYEEFLDEHHQMHFTDGLTIEMMNAITEYYNFIDGDSHSKIKFFIF